MIDGAPLAEEEARALWERFSAWMEEHRGDLAGFAAREGFASVHPGVDANGPVLRVSRTEQQRPYTAVGRGDGPKPAGPKSPPAGSRPKKRRRRM